MQVKEGEILLNLRMLVIMLLFLYIVNKQDLVRTVSASYMTEWYNLFI